MVRVRQVGPDLPSGLRRPRRNVSLERPLRDASTDARLLAAQVVPVSQVVRDARNPEAANIDERLGFTAAPVPVDEGWLSPASEESLATGWDLVRPFQLRDVGLGGLPGQIPIPIPGSGVFRGAGRHIAKGAGKAEDFWNWLRKGDDVVDEVADLTQPMLPNTGGVPRVTPTQAPSGRPTIRMQHGRPRPNTVAPPGAAQPELFPPHVEGLAATGRTPVPMLPNAAAEGARLRAMIQDPTVRSRWWREATESAAPIRVGDNAARLPRGATANLDEIIEYGEGAGSRTIVQVKLADGTTQPFYRSTGFNSGQPGGWFPFEGLQIQPGRVMHAGAEASARSGVGRGWVIKQAGHPNVSGELAEIAQALKAHEALGRIHPTLLFSGGGATNEIEIINVLLGRNGMGGLRGSG
jgi:hypothetical protein